MDSGHRHAATRAVTHPRHAPYPNSWEEVPEDDPRYGPREKHVSRKTSNTAVIEEQGRKNKGFAHYRANANARKHEITWESDEDTSPPVHPPQQNSRSHIQDRSRTHASNHPDSPDQLASKSSATTQRHQPFPLNAYGEADDIVQVLSPYGNYIRPRKSGEFVPKAKGRRFADDSNEVLPTSSSGRDLKDPWGTANRKSTGRHD